MLERRLPDVPEDGVAGPPRKDHNLDHLNAERCKAPRTSDAERVAAKEPLARVRLDLHADQQQVDLERPDDVHLLRRQRVLPWEERK